MNIRSGFLLFSTFFFLSTMLTAHIAIAAENNRQYDIRKIRWGMSMEEVALSEKEGATYANKLENQLLYTTQLFDSDCIIAYDFNGNKKIFQASYIIQNLNKDKKDKIFETLNQKFREKYEEALPEGGYNDPINALLLKMHREFFNDRTAITITQIKDNVVVSYTEISEYKRAQKK